MNQITFDDRRDEVLTTLRGCASKTFALTDVSRKYLELYKGNEEIKDALEKALRATKEAVYAFDNAADMVEEYDLWSVCPVTGDIHSVDNTSGKCLVCGISL